MNVAPECWSSGVHGTACCWPGPLPRITIYSWCSLLSVCHCKSATPLFSLFFCLPTACLSVKRKVMFFWNKKISSFLIAELRIIGLRPWPITTLTLSFVILHITHSPGPLQWIIMVYDSFPLMYMITLTLCFFLSNMQERSAYHCINERTYLQDKQTQTTPYLFKEHSCLELNKRPRGSTKTTFRRQQSKAGPNLLH